ncbi:hypothetical protein HK099_000884 [Clydaea vesicula]|uniref:Uncharacterized protein n=1 Tax=Clydaea vesicula TaxID=447962 RepID=A0AAD5Y215_9FUNG|nr:hypothetical protein HK099_000884 [Clydaea vesicula]
MNEKDEFHDSLEKINEQGFKSNGPIPDDQSINSQKSNKEIAQKILSNLKKTHEKAEKPNRWGDIDDNDQKLEDISVGGLMAAKLAAKKFKNPELDNSLIESKAKAAKARETEKQKFTGFLFNPNFTDVLPQQLHSAYLKLSMEDVNLHNQIESLRPTIEILIYWENLTSTLVWSLSMCFVWFLARFNFSIVWLLIVVFYVGGSLKRNLHQLKNKIRRSVKDELSHLKMTGEDGREAVEWFNIFLSKYWVNYEPGLSSQIQESINYYLRLYKPTFLEDMLFTTFSLGSEAPRIEFIHTYPKTEDDIITMDWAINFTPFDEGEKIATSNRKSSKLELKLFVGKGGMTVAIPTVVKDVSLVGLMQVSIKFSSTFPHVKFVDICFKDIPEVTFNLRPLKGLDLMDMPGLNNSIHQMIKDQLKANVVDPVKIHLPLEEWAGAVASYDKPVGVLKVTVYQARSLKNRESIGLSDPYTKFIIGDKEIGRTHALNNTLNPNWGGSEHFIIIYESHLDPATDSDTLYFEIFDENETTKDKSMGRTNALKLSQWIKLAQSGPPTAKLNEGGDEDDEDEAIKEDAEEKKELLGGLTDAETTLLLKEWGSPFDATSELWKPLFMPGKEQKSIKGELKVNLVYFPVPKTDAVVVNEEEDDIESGIVTFTVHQVRDMAASLKAQNMSVVSELNTGEEIGRTNVIKKTATPVWDKSFDIFVKDVEGAKIKLKVLNNDHVTGFCLLDVSDILAKTNQSNDWYKLKGIPSGRVRVSIKFKPVDLEAENLTSSKPSSFMRICVREANDLKNVEMMSKSDPYCKVTLGNQHLGKTSTIEDNLNPVWKETFNVIAYTGTQVLAFSLFDFNGISKDKPIGRVSLRLDDLIDFNEIEKYLSEVLGTEVLEPTKSLLKSNVSLDDTSKAKDLLLKLQQDGLKIQSISPVFAEIWAPIYINKNKIKEIVKGKINFSIEVFPIVQNKVIKVDKKSRKKRKELMKQAGSLESVRADEGPDDTKVNESDTHPNIVVEEENVHKKTSKNSLIDLAEFERVKSIVDDFSAGIFQFKIHDAQDLDKNRNLYCVLQTAELKDPGVKITHGVSSSTYSTRIIQDSKTPSWNETCEIFVSNVKKNAVHLQLKYSHNEEKSNDDKTYAVWTGEGEKLLKTIGQANNWLTLEPTRITDLTSRIGNEVNPSVRVSVSYFPVYMEDETVSDDGELKLEILEASNLDALDRGGTSDPYIVVKCNSDQVFKTKTIKKTVNPKFNESCHVKVDSKKKANFKFEVYDHNTLQKHGLLGHFNLVLRSLPSNETVVKDFKLEGGGGYVKLQLFFKQKEDSSSHEKKSTTKKVLGLFGKNKEQKENKEDTEKEDTLSPLSSMDHGLSNKNSVLSIKDAASKQSQVGIGLPTSLSINSLSSRISSSHSVNEESNVIGEGIIKIVEARNLKAADSNGLSDPYIKIVQFYHGKMKQLHKTSVQKKTLSPTFNETFKCKVPLKFKILAKGFVDIGESSEIDIFDLLFPENTFESETSNPEVSKLTKKFDDWLPMGDGCGEVHLSGDFNLSILNN